MGFIAPSPGYIDRGVAALLGLAHRLSGADVEVLAAYSKRLLARPETHSGRAPSVARTIVNAEGYPLEYSISSSPNGLRHRLMGDPAACMEDGWERYRAARSALARLLEESGAMALAPTLATLFAHMAHVAPAGLRRYPAGCFWMGRAINTPGIAVFVTADIPDRDAWSSLDGWLRATLPNPDEALAFVDRLRPFARLASVGIEGVSSNDAVLKIYWRLERVVPIAAMGAKPLEQPAFSDFLRMVMSDVAIGRDGLLCDAAFALRSGAWVDAKIFLCGHCLAFPAGEWQRRIDAVTGHFGLTDITVGHLLDKANVDVSFLGFGLDMQERPRLNVYLKPSLPPQAAS